MLTLSVVLVIILSSPAQAKWTALASVVAVSGGLVSYIVYVKRARGHVVHSPDWLEALIKKRA